MRRGKPSKSWPKSSLAADVMPESVKNHLVILKEMLKYAVEWRYLKVNPATGIRAPELNGKRWTD